MSGQAHDVSGDGKWYMATVTIVPAPRRVLNEINLGMVCRPRLAQTAQTARGEAERASASARQVRLIGKARAVCRFGQRRTAVEDKPARVEQTEVAHVGHDRAPDSLAKG